jgi:hypothetical protein
MFDLQLRLIELLKITDLYDNQTFVIVTDKNNGFMCENNDVESIKHLISHSFEINNPIKYNTRI